MGNETEDNDIDQAASRVRLGWVLTCSSTELILEATSEIPMISTTAESISLTLEHSITTL